MPAYIRATKTRRVILATDESTMALAQSRRRWLKYGASWKEKEGTKKIGVQKKKKKNHKGGGNAARFFSHVQEAKWELWSLTLFTGPYNPWYADRMPGLRAGEESWQKCSSHKSVSIFLTPRRIKRMGALSNREPGASRSGEGWRDKHVSYLGCKQEKHLRGGKERKKPKKKHLRSGRAQ